MVTGLCRPRNPTSGNWMTWKIKVIVSSPIISSRPVYTSVLSARISKVQLRSPLPPEKPSLELLSDRLLNGRESQLAHVSAPFPPKTVTIRSSPGVRGMKPLQAQQRAAAGQIHLR